MKLWEGAMWIGRTQILLVIVAIAFAAFAAPGARSAQENANADAVKERSLLQQMKRVQGLGTIPDVKSYVLEQPMGRVWRQFRETWLQLLGSVAILGMCVLLVAFYLWRGMVRIKSGRSGGAVVRFGPFERFVHWMTATSFIVLALSGLNITFGKHLLLPMIGPSAFSSWSQAAKYAHNFFSFPFALGVLLIFCMWLAGNIPNRVDLEWLKRGGGMIGDDHPPAYRFNGGQKAVYWIVVLGGAAIALSGYLLMFPFYGTNIAGMQLAQVAHSVIAMLFIAVMLAHIYIGTIGMEGAFEAMGNGTVDINWAKEHHSLWIEKEKPLLAGSELQRHQSVTAAE